MEIHSSVLRALGTQCRKGHGAVSVQLRGSVVLKQKKNKRQDLLSNVPKVLHFTPVCSGGFLVAVLPVRQHKVRDP